MTQQQDILDDPNYIPLLDHGFIGLVDHLGEDTSIVQAARVSYGAGTKSVREDRGLIRYLMRHEHTSPFELNAIKLHIKAPIFVLRQLYRHRTHSANESSARYSIMTDEFYLPDPDVIQPQSSDNKQGRSGNLSDENKSGVQWMMKSVYNLAYDCYQTLLGEKDKSKFTQGDVPYGAYDEDDPVFDADFNGVARELARAVLPVANYSELYWQQNLLNMFRLLKLRTDAHAQYEIRVYADAICKLVEPYFPLAFEAFDDYQRYSIRLSRMEKNLMKELLGGSMSPMDAIRQMISGNGGLKAFAESRDMSLREIKDFMENFGLHEE